MFAFVYFVFLLASAFAGTVKGNYHENDVAKKIMKRETKCYDKLGCFSNNPPYDNILPFTSLPESPSSISTSFLLYTRKNPIAEHLLVLGKSCSVRSSNFKPFDNTIFIIHGWRQTGGGRASWIKDLIRALLKKESLNVISVNWLNGADSLKYWQSAANTRVVGAQVAQLIEFLNKETSTANSQYHIIGHSLGAHAAGYAGERLPGLRRISGLDPASYGFENKDALVRLDPTDASFVDVIHTDAESDGFGVGAKQAIGHVDFYPNGGQSRQPGCGFLEYKCDHIRVLALYTESVNSECPFTAYPCAGKSEWQSLKYESNCGTGGCSNMGYNVDPKTTPGKYYLYTTSSSPFCGYLYRFNILLSDDQGFLLYGNVFATLHGTKGDSTTLKSDSKHFHANDKLGIRGILSRDIGVVTQVTVTFDKAFYSWSSKLNVAGIEVVDKWGNRRGRCLGNIILRDEDAQSFVISESVSLDSC